MPQSDKPTSKQLSYLKALASQTGTTFTYPKTKAEASREIETMKARLGDTNRRIERDNARLERRDISTTASSAEHLSAAVRDDEVVGYGASATWAHGS